MPLHLNLCKRLNPKLPETFLPLVAIPITEVDQLKDQSN